jgi:hypothetical protein
MVYANASKTSTKKRIRSRFREHSSRQKSSIAGAAGNNSLAEEMKPQFMPLPWRTVCKVERQCPQDPHGPFGCIAPPATMPTMKPPKYKTRTKAT